MNDRMMQEAAGYTARRRRRHLWRKIVGVLAAVAVFGTTYALILPAITLEKTGCSIPEHTHTQACWRPPVCSGGQWGLETEWLGLPRVSALRAGPSGGKSPHVISQREGLVLVAGGEGQGPLPVSRAPQ